MSDRGDFATLASLKHPGANSRTLGIQRIWRTSAKAAATYNLYLEKSNICLRGSLVSRTGKISRQTGKLLRLDRERLLPFAVRSGKKQGTGGRDRVRGAINTAIGRRGFAVFVFERARRGGNLKSTVQRDDGEER